MTQNKTEIQQYQPQQQSALAQMATRFNLEPDKMLAVLRGTVIKASKDGRQATNEEVAAFVVVCNQYGLNPFTKEIYAFPDPKRGGVVPIVGVDGWAHIINDQPRFDGMEFEEQDDDNGKPYSVTCIMHVKDRNFPIKVTEYFSECKRGTDPWNTMPRRMLRHKAMMQAARYAFSLSGIYDPEEAEDIISGGGGPSLESQMGAAVRAQLPQPQRLSQKPKSDPLPISNTPTVDVDPEPDGEQKQETPTAEEKSAEIGPHDQAAILLEEAYAAAHNGELPPEGAALDTLNKAIKPMFKKAVTWADVPVDTIEKNIIPRIKSGAITIPPKG